VLVAVAALMGAAEEESADAKTADAGWLRLRELTRMIIWSGSFPHSNQLPRDLTARRATGYCESIILDFWFYVEVWHGRAHGLYLISKICVLRRDITRQRYCGGTVLIERYHSREQVFGRRCLLQRDLRYEISDDRQRQDDSDDSASRTLKKVF
jgi:hypothetical protein